MVAAAPGMMTAEDTRYMTRPLDKIRFLRNMSCQYDYAPGAVLRLDTYSELSATRLLLTFPCKTLFGF